MKAKNIAVCGFMGCGKTTVAESCAKMLGMTFADTDAITEKDCNMKINEIFKNLGEDYFRQKEYEILKMLCENKNMFVSLGGGTVLDPRCRELLKQHCITVFLDVPFDIITARLKNDTSRPLIKNKNTDEIYSLYLQRREVYLSCADLVITGNNTPFAAAGEIAKRIKAM